MGRKRTKPEPRTVDELKGEERQIFNNMVEEMKVAMEKKGLYDSFMKDIRTRCSDELGVKPKELNYYAKLKYDAHKLLQKHDEDSVRIEMARILKIIPEECDEE